MSKLSRRKGATWERKLARMLRPIFGESVHRGHQNTHGGYAAGEGCDVEGTPYFIEAKHRKRVNPRAALNQARACQAKCDDTRPRVAVCKIDHQKPTATMELEQWIALVIKWATRRHMRGEKINSITKEIPLVTVDLDVWLAIVAGIEGDGEEQ